MLDDLSFFRFPPLTPGTVQAILLLFVLLGVTIVGTVVAQRIIQRHNETARRRRAFNKLIDDLHIEEPMRRRLHHMLDVAGVHDEFDLIKDATLYETVVDGIARRASEQDFTELTHLRRKLRMNVLNPHVHLVNTRQLMHDQAIRLIVPVDHDRLDLYCSLLSVTDHYMLIDVPYQQDVHELLERHPDVTLVFWREGEGETVFRTRVEAVEAGRMTLFRAPHAFRDEGTKREAVRLTVHRPLEYHFIRRQDLARRLRTHAKDVHPIEGEGTLVDLSQGGAAFIAAHVLEVGGFAQLEFTFNKEPLRLVTEVLSSAPIPEGGVMVRGRFRGLSNEVRNRLHFLISREQVRRLRQKGIFQTGPSQAPAPRPGLAKRPEADQEADDA